MQKVLLVDDHDMYLKYCTREFVKAGVDVNTASNLDDAIALLRDERPDVAFVDLFLTPPETGLEVIRTLKAVDPDLYCVLVSAHMSVSHAMMGVRAGADDVFLKPFGAKQAIARIEQGAIDRPFESTPTLHEIEWEHISRVLNDHAGNISRAAESLGVFRQSLQRKILKHAPRAIAVDGPPPEEPPPLPPKPARKSKARPIKRRGH